MNKNRNKTIPGHMLICTAIVFIVLSSGINVRAQEPRVPEVVVVDVMCY